MNITSKSGVYLIQFHHNTLIYIGSSINIKRRTRSHLNLLRKNKHYNYLLQSDFNNFGESNIQYCAILECPPEEVTYQEQRFIEFFNSASRGYGYNLAKTSQNPIGKLNPMFGKRHSEKTKNKWSLLRKGRKISKSHRQKIINYLRSSMNKLRGRKRTEEEKKSYLKDINNRKIELTLINPIGETIKMRGVKEFCTTFNLNEGQISKLCRKIIKKYKGWTLPNE